MAASPEGANPDTISWNRVRAGHWNGVLKALVAEHVAETQSRFARNMLNDWELEIGRFWQIVPKEMLGRLPYALDETIMPEAVAAGPGE